MYTQSDIVVNFVVQPLLDKKWIHSFPQILVADSLVVNGQSYFEECHYKQPKSLPLNLICFTESQIGTRRETANCYSGIALDSFGCWLASSGSGSNAPGAYVDTSAALCNSEEMNSDSQLSLADIDSEIVFLIAT